MKAVAIGDGRRLAGYRLAGAQVIAAADAAEALAAWEAIPTDAGLLVLTPDAYAALEPRLRDQSGLVWAVLPS